MSRETFVFEIPSIDKRVVYYPRTGLGEKEGPKASAVVAAPDATATFKRQYNQANGAEPERPPLLVKTIEASGITADAVAYAWVSYQALVSAVGVAKNPDAQKWKAWSTEVLAGAPLQEGQDNLTAAQASQFLIGAIGQQPDKVGGKKSTLTPLAEAIRGVLRANIDLSHMNGTSPAPELLPPSALTDPVEIMGTIALDLTAVQVIPTIVRANS